MHMPARLAAFILAFLLVGAAWAAEGAGAAAKAGAPVRMEWTVDGVAREALVWIPPSAKSTPAPVVFAFHGHGGTMKQAASGNAYYKLWPEAISVYMQGLNTPGFLVDPEGKKPGWQAFQGDQGDRDLKFFDAVLTTLRTGSKVDDKRIYCTGHSNGGGFTYLLWSERPEVFAAVAPSAAAWFTPGMVDKLPKQFAALAATVAKSAKPLKPLPVMHLAGEKDQLVKFEWQKLTIDSLIALNGCGEGKAMGDGVTYYTSKGGTPVVTLIHPGGHGYPEGASALIVKFFQGQAKP